MSKKFEKVLSEQELAYIFESMGYAGGHETFLDITNEVQKAVLAKLAEQEPSALDGFILVNEEELIELSDSILGNYYRGQDWERERITNMLKAAPCVSPMNSKTFCVSENEKCDTQTTSIEAREMNNDETLNETIQILEDLVQAIKDRNLNRFDDLTYDTENVYCSGQGLAVIADLASTRIIIEGEIGNE